MSLAGRIWSEAEIRGRDGAPSHRALETQQRLWILFLSARESKWRVLMGKVIFTDFSFKMTHLAAVWEIIWVAGTAF